MLVSLKDPISNGDRRENIALDLILALQTQLAARILQSRHGDGTLGGDLGGLFSRIDSNQLDIKSVALLLKAVINGAKDEDIWVAVYALIALTKPTHLPTTPPRSGPSFILHLSRTHLLLSTPVAFKTHLSLLKR